MLTKTRFVDKKHCIHFKNSFPEHVVAFTTDRSVDFAETETTGLLTQEQKTFLEQCSGVEISDIIALKQVHGSRVFTVEKKDFHKMHSADGAATNNVNVPLTVRTADCLPVFLFDERQNVICLIHAGWNGCRKRIATHAIHHMYTSWSSKPRDMRVVFGPGIRSCCYQVGKEFNNFFPDEIIKKDTGLYLDLPSVVRRQLRDAGIPKSNISDCELCTCCNNRFFSYRREGAQAGRMLSVIFLTSPNL